MFLRFGDAKRRPPLRRPLRILLQFRVMMHRIILDTSASMSCKAFVAVDGLICLGFKRNFSRLSALCTYCIVHYPFAAVVTAGIRLTAGSAALATGRCIFKALFVIKFLFTGSEGELLAAILANQHFVFKHWYNTPFVIWRTTRLTWSLPPHSPVGRFATKHYAAHYCFSRDIPDRTYI